MEFAERKGAELAEKAAGLKEELDRWLEISAPGAKLEKHCTQVRAITNVLVLHMESAGDGRPLGDGEEELLVRAAERERDLLALHRIWGYFRSKLALRFVPWFGEYLSVADELAWNCYKPAQRHITVDVGKEPPLVYLNGGSSPFTTPRGSSWLAEEVPGEGLRAEQLGGVLRELPVPVIGVPWFHVRHLPDSPAIGHEVGHDVEHDLGLTETLRSLVDRGLCASQAGEERRAAWRAWSGEVFADVYGTLATGPAYVGALSDFIAAPRHRVAQEWRGNGVWGSYPTRTLRVLICARVLERIGLGEQASVLRDGWVSKYENRAMANYEEDVPHVVDRLLDGRWPELGDPGLLTDIVTFTAEMQADVEEGASCLLEGCVPQTKEVRSTLAAARCAYEIDPAQYRALQAARWTVGRVEELKQAGPRGSGETAPPEDARDKRDRRAAARLARSLGRAHDDGYGGDDE